MKHAPCKDCPDRTVTCHSVCQKYEDWKIERAAMLDWQREQNHVEISDYALRQHWRNKRLKNRKYATKK